MQAGEVETVEKGFKSKLRHQLLLNIFSLILISNEAATG